MSDYPKPVITADVIAYRFKTATEVQILLIQRAKEPFKDKLAFPGGHFDILTDPSIEYAAIRELAEETGLNKEDFAGDSQFFRYYDAADRDPRGRYVDFVFVVEIKSIAEAKAADDAKELGWIDVDKITAEMLAFDHWQIFREYFGFV